MPQIHLHAEPGDYAPVVLLPGDPNRATRIAARFDGGIDASKPRHVASRPARVHGHGGRRPGVGPDDDDGRADDLDRGRGAAHARRDDVHPRRDHGRLRRAPRSATRSWRCRPRPTRASAACSVAARRRPRRPASMSSSPSSPRRRAAGLTTHVGPVVTGDVFYDPTPGGSGRWGRRGYLSAEMETAALYLIAMREQGKGRPVRAGCILTVSDVIADPAEGGETPRGRSGDVVPAARG